MEKRRKSTSRLYYADECIPVTSITHLRSRGFSIIHAYEKGYVRKKDLEQIKISKKLDRVLIALDKDFWQKRKFSLTEHPGIIILKTTSSIPNAVNRVAEKVLKRAGNLKLRGSILYASIDKICRWKNGKENVITWKK
jgi:predicted nuclease of predicted toxin-antitoxin system